jgi:hypothetical protein
VQQLFQELAYGRQWQMTLDGQISSRLYLSRRAARDLAHENQSVIGQFAQANHL